MVLTVGGMRLWTRWVSEPEQEESMHLNSLWFATGRITALLAIPVIVVGACSTAGTKRLPTTHPQTVDTIPIPPTLHPVQPGEPMYGSFQQDAIIRLEALQGWLYRYQQRYGKLPATLDDFAPTRAHESDLRYDPWQHLVRFRVAGEGYEIRSAGEDGVFSNADDIILQGQRGRREACLLGPVGILTYPQRPSPCPAFPT